MKKRLYQNEVPHPEQNFPPVALAPQFEQNEFPPPTGGDLFTGTEPVFPAG